MSRRSIVTLAIVSVALFMVTLDNLVVTTALPSIRADLGASLEALEWTVNAYTLAFAVLLLTGAALGDRFGRRRMFLVGLGIFTAASALAALAPSTGALIAARAIQGARRAIVTPLTLTLLSRGLPRPASAASPSAIWSGVTGLVRRARPAGRRRGRRGPRLAVRVLDQRAGRPRAHAARRPRPGREPRARAARSTSPGVALGASACWASSSASSAATRAGWAHLLVRRIAGSPAPRCSSPSSSRSPARTTPMLPTRFFRSRAFTATNAVSLAMYFGMFGSIFFLAQVFQTAQGYFGAGGRPADAAVDGHADLRRPARGRPVGPDRRAPADGHRAHAAGDRDRVDRHRAQGRLTPCTWKLDPRVRDGRRRHGAGVRPGRHAVLCVRPFPRRPGQASGATNAIREVGGVMGVAILAAVFAGAGSTPPPPGLIAGVQPALWVGAAVLAAGALAALLVPGSGAARRLRRRRPSRCRSRPAERRTARGEGVGGFRPRSGWIRPGVVGSWQTMPMNPPRPRRPAPAPRPSGPPLNAQLPFPALQLPLEVARRRSASRG